MTCIYQLQPKYRLHFKNDPTCCYENLRISDWIGNKKSYASVDPSNDLFSSGCLSTGVSGDSKNLTFRLFNGTVEIGVENWKLSISLFASLLIWLNVVTSCFGKSWLSLLTLFGDVVSVFKDVFRIGEVTGKWADNSGPGVPSKELSMLDLKQY